MTTMKGLKIGMRIPSLKQSLNTLAVFIFLLIIQTPARATAIDLATGGVTFASARLVIDGIDLGLNAANAGAGVILNRPWVFMFADGTPAPQDFASAVGPPGGVASNMASSSGFLGTATSSALANAIVAGGALIPVAVTRGAASANALAGIGTTGISAVPFGTALRAHITTIVIDPLNSPDSPVSQLPPPDPDTFPVFDPAFEPASAIIDAFLINELGISVSLFHLEASLGFNNVSGRFDDLNLTVTGLGGTPSTLITESDFSFFNSPEGFGYRLDDMDLTIPYNLPLGWENLTYSATLEAQANAASSVPIPEPSTLVLFGIGALSALGYRLRRELKVFKIFGNNEEITRTPIVY